MKTLGGSADDIGTFVIQSRDDSYMLAGIASSLGLGRADAWLAKIQGEPVNCHALKDVACDYVKSRVASGGLTKPP